MPLKLNQEFVDKIKASLPELPDAKKQRYIDDFGLSNYDAGVLTADKDVTEFFEEAIQGHNAKLVCNWLTGELFGRLNKAGQELTDSKINARQLGDLVGLIEDNTISGKIAKDVLDEMFANGGEPADIVEEKGLKQVTDTGAIEAAVDEVIAANPDKVEEYKGGKDKLFGFFVGQVMKATGGKANPQAVNEVLKAKLG